MKWYGEQDGGGLFHLDAETMPAADFVVDWLERYLSWVSYRIKTGRRQSHRGLHTLDALKSSFLL